MSTPPSLTVGIPTYNRVNAVVERVGELLQYRDTVDIRILVIDNASTDGTFESLTSEFDGTDVDIRRNEENLGFAGNFLRLVEVTETDYLTVISDEDQVELDGLVSLIALLRDHRPRFVSPRAQTGENDCYRGRRATRPMKPEEFQSASFYLSGITFEAAAAKRHATVVHELVSHNAAAKYYPQVLLTALAILDGEGMFLDALVTRQVVVLETHLIDARSGAYWFVPGRWAQFEGYEEFFKGTLERLPHSAQEIARMQTSIRSSILSLLKKAAVLQYPELSEHMRPPRQSLARRVIRVLRGR